MFCLKVPTSEAWARVALSNLDDVLVDHAHCEMKAAANALSLATSHEVTPTTSLALADLAVEETEHFRRVVALLAERGKKVGVPDVDDYAMLLRKRVRGLGSRAGITTIVDRLLIAALIEARSCERFKRLIAALESTEQHALAALYRELFEAEARHYRLFVDLALAQANAAEDLVRERLSEVADCEAEVIRDLERNAVKATVHG